MTAIGRQSKKIKFKLCSISTVSGIMICGVQMCHLRQGTQSKIEAVESPVYRNNLC